MNKGKKKGRGCLEPPAPMPRRVSTENKRPDRRAASWELRCQLLTTRSQPTTLSKVAVYRAGGLGDPSALIRKREIAATDGYTAGVPDDAHFGLGTNTEIDVRVTLPPGSRGLATNGVIEVRNVPADRYLRLPDGRGGAYRDGQKH